MKLSMASELQMCCQVSAAMINQLQLLFRYIHVSLGHQHQKHERTPSAHGQRYFVVRDEVKHNKGRARDLGRIKSFVPRLHLWLEMNRFIFTLYDRDSLFYYSYQLREESLTMCRHLTASTQAP